MALKSCGFVSVCSSLQWDEPVLGVGQVQAATFLQAYVVTVTLYRPVELDAVLRQDQVNSMNTIYFGSDTTTRGILIPDMWLPDSFEYRTFQSPVFEWWFFENQLFNLSEVKKKFCAWGSCQVK